MTDNDIPVVMTFAGTGTTYEGTLKLDGVSAVVLDEADEMLDMGFAEDIELILDAAPAERQTALFSATLPPRIAAIADKHLRAPQRVLIAREKAAKGAAPRVRQTAYVVQRAHKVAALGRVLDLESPTLALVFARTRTEVDELAEKLRGRGYQVELLHGGLSQDQRDRVMKRVRAGSVELLVATDVAARGLDVEHLSHVVNFNVPASPESYVHRIGRTGRAGASGIAVTFVDWADVTRWKVINRQLDLPFDGNILFEDLEAANLQVIADPRAIRATYKEVVQEFIADMRKQCHDSAIDYQLISTATPLDQALASYLSWRG